MMTPETGRVQGVANEEVSFRRGQRGYLNWARMRRLEERWIPIPRVLHPYARKPFQCSDRVDIDIPGNQFYSRDTLPVSVSELTDLGNARGGVNPADLRLSAHRA